MSGAPAGDARLRETLEALLQRRDLTAEQAGELLRALTDTQLAPAMSGALLIALRAKGVTATELRGLAAAMRQLARPLPLAAGLDAIDIVGTGGDGSGSFNLSTGAALLTAACGLPVIKHGNRSVSSRCGSADLIEALGFSLPLDAARAAACFEATGFTFLFAPYYHPAMRAVAAVRTALAVRTVFNLLGPLTNPAAPRFQLMGAYDAAAAELLAHALAGMRFERAWVIHGAGGWDEASPLGPFLLFDVTRDGVARSEIDPLDFALPRCSAPDLAGGDADHNLAALRAVFDGQDRGPHAAALLLQAGMALTVAGRSASIGAGVAAARSVLESGQAQRWLASLQRFAATPRSLA